MIPTHVKTWDSGPYLYIDDHYELHLYYQDTQIPLNFPPILRCLYFFYLKHPEGVCRYKLPEYEKQIRGIYNFLVRIGNPKGKKARIDQLVDRWSNSFNEKCTRIKTTFMEHLEDEEASDLCIDGQRKLPKSIRFSRERVIWQNDLPNALAG